MAEIYSSPTGLSATASSSSTIALAWTNTEFGGGDGVPVEIQRKASGGTYQTIQVSSPGDSSYPDTGCSGNTRYYYRVRYLLNQDTSPWSNEADDYTNPATPSGLAVTWVGKTATLTWTNNNTYTYIEVYYKLSTELVNWTTDTGTLTGTLTTRDIVVSAESRDHDFRIRGYDSTSGLNSDYNTIVSKTSGVMAPTGLAGIASGGVSVGLTWADNSSVEDGYEVYYKLTSATDWTPFGTTAANATTSNVTGLTGGLSYDFRVRAKDGAVYSSYCSSITIVVVSPPSGTPGTPTAVSTGQTTQTITWTDTATGATKFYLYYSAAGATEVEAGNVLAGVQTYSATGLVAHTSYVWRTRAWNTGGWSASYSSASAAVLTDLDLDPPTALIADAISSTRIDLSFTVNATNATTHSVERKVSGGSYEVKGSTTTPTEATYPDGTCAADTEYTYRVRAYHSTPATYGDYSSPISKKTLAVGTDTVRRNEAFFAMGNVLCIASETPQNSFAAYWRSKPLDFSEMDPSDANKDKTAYMVQLEYTDTYASVPVVVSLSSDGGTTWVTASETIGTGDGTDKSQNFWFSGLTGKYITLKASVTSATKGFTWTGISLFYISRGEHLEAT